MGNAKSQSDDAAHVHEIVNQAPTMPVALPQAPARNIHQRPHAEKGVGAPFKIKTPKIDSITINRALVDRIAQDKMGGSYKYNIEGNIVNEHGRILKAICLQVPFADTRRIDLCYFQYNNLSIGYEEDLYYHAYPFGSDMQHTLTRPSRELLDDLIKLLHTKDAGFAAPESRGHPRQERPRGHPRPEGVNGGSRPARRVYRAERQSGSGRNPNFARDTKFCKWLTGLEILSMGAKFEGEAPPVNITVAPIDGVPAQQGYKIVFNEATCRATVRVKQLGGTWKWPANDNSYAKIVDMYVDELSPSQWYTYRVARGSPVKIHRVYCRVVNNHLEFAAIPTFPTELQ